MPDLFSGDFKLGILGGGQLGKMLIPACMRLNIQVHILDGDENAPCRNFCTRFVHGRFTDFDAVYEFGKTVDLLTIEIENVNIEALEKLQSEGVKIYPQPEVIKTIKDKGLQKQFYRRNTIPTASFELVENAGQAREIARKKPVVQKLRTEGYDGRGVQVLRSEKDFEKAFDAPSVVEDLVDIHRELSVIVARNTEGEIRAYEPVELHFDPQYNLVDYLYSPSQLPKKTLQRAMQLGREVAEELEIVGLLAVEMFADKQGNVLVNEAAPRPHNSGHHTIEAFETSQYEQLLRAITGLPLGSTRQIIPAVMINLLGAESFTGEAVYEGMEEALDTDGVHVHLYGKKFTRPGRKMGHITVTDPDLDIAVKRALELKNQLKIRT